MNLYNISGIGSMWLLTREQRLIIVAFEGVFILSHLYLSLAVSYFLKTRGLENHKPHSKLQNILTSLVFFLFFFGILKSTLVLFSLVYPMPEPDHCHLIEKLFQGLSSLALACLYVFLWLRQYTLYRAPSLRTLVSPWLAAKYFLIYIAIVGIGGSVATVLTGNVEHHYVINKTDQCVFLEEVDPNTMTILAIYLFIVVGQGFLLFLFVHILRKHQQDLSRYHVRSRSSSSKLYRVIRNSTIASSVGLLSDVIATVLNTALSGSIAQPVFFFIWEVNYVINVSCVLFCFANWPMMLLPCRARSKQKEIRKLTKIIIRATMSRRSADTKRRTYVPGPHKGCSATHEEH